jgi:hypothetical protein
MRKPLISALGLVSLAFLSDIAFASDPKPIGAVITPEHLKSICGSNGGSFTFEEGGGGICKFKWGTTWECNSAGSCNGWKALTRPKGNAGPVTTAGGLGNAQFPGGTTGPVASTGATGTARAPVSGPAPGSAPAPTATGTLNGSPNGPVVRDHRPGGNASDAPPAAGTAPARAPTAVGTLNGGLNGAVVRDHRPGGNALNAPPAAAAPGGTSASQKYRTLQ